MTEPQHYSAETPKDNSTIKCVLGILGAVVAFLSTKLCARLIISSGIDPIMATVVLRSVLAVLFIVLLGGGSWLRFSPQTVRNAWKYSWFMIVINIALSLLITLNLAMQFLQGELDTSSALYWVGYSTVLCILIGVNEEGMFRGLLLGGMLAKLGNKKNGPLIAAIASSLVFGAVHVIFDMDFSNALVIAMGLLKTLETSMFALVLCAPVMQDKNLCGAMTVHAFFDWVILCGSTVAEGGMRAPTYVSADPQVAIPTMIVFGVLVLLYLPKTIRAIKDLRDMELPQYGPFIEG